jgi:hypothetical protein
MKFRSIFTSTFVYVFLLKYYTPPDNSQEKEKGQNLTSGPKGNSPNKWFQSLLIDLLDQQLLRENVLSKEILWQDYRPPRSMQDPQKHALVYLGWVAFWNMESDAKLGGPAGEFVIWGDFITALAALGYQLTIVKHKIDFWIYLKANPMKYDIIVTDYDGLGTAENIGHFPLYHCSYYLIDGFGTQEKFNTKRHLDLKRILTPYPFDGSNSPINIVTSVLPKRLWSSPKLQGVIWGKDPAYLHSHLSTIKFLSQTLNITLVTTFRKNMRDKKSIRALHELKASFPNISEFPQSNAIPSTPFWERFSSWIWATIGWSHTSRSNGSWMRLHQSVIFNTICSAKQTHPLCLPLTASFYPRACP